MCVCARARGVCACVVCVCVRAWCVRACVVCVLCVCVTVWCESVRACMYDRHGLFC